MGPDLTELSWLTDRIQSVIKTDPDMAPITASVAADRSIGGSYIDLDIDRRALARHGADHYGRAANDNERSGWCDADPYC